MACPDLQFQAVLWPLVKHALDVSNTESDTLVEEGLRLLQAALSASSELPPAALVRLARLALLP